MEDLYLEYLIDPSFQALNRLFVISFQDSAVRNEHRIYFLSTVKIKDDNVMIDGKFFFWSSKTKNCKNWNIFCQIAW